MGYSTQVLGDPQTWIPTFTGFSADPSSVTAHYIVIGKFCWFWINATAGTSNATTFTITLPIAANATAIVTNKMRGIDNNTNTTNCMIRTRTNSTIADVFPTESISSTWTAAASNKNIIGAGFYETI